MKTMSFCVKKKNMYFNRQFSKIVGSPILSDFDRFWPILTDSVAYPVQQSDQMSGPLISSLTGWFDLVFKILG